MIVSLSILSPLSVRAGECDEIISTCDKALSTRKEEIKLCQLGLVQTLDQNQILSSELARKNSQLQAWYRSPWLLLALGLAAGIVVAK